MSNKVVSDNELMWEWENGPYYKVGRQDRYRQHIRVDPTPAYPHDPELVRRTLDWCEKVCPLPIPPIIFLLDREGVGRTSGQTHYDHNYEKKDAHDRYEDLPFIVLFAKRIPQHPGMTRYLVAHEYGHVVDHVLAHMRYTDRTPWESQREEYAKLRGVQGKGYYGPGSWHVSAGELLANDFRILITGIETEYWPHPGIPHPQLCPEVQEWWKKAMEDIASLTAPKTEVVSASTSS